jgi:ribosome-binding factor A
MSKTSGQWPAGRGEATSKPRAKIKSRKPNAASKGPSQRQLRLGELIRHAMAELLQRGAIYGEALSSTIVTVPEVRLSPDLKIATVYVMPLGGADAKPVIDDLSNSRGFIRSEVARHVNMKFAPDLRFRRDETFDEAERINRLLRSPVVRQDLAVQAGTDAETDNNNPDSTDE